MRRVVVAFALLVALPKCTSSEEPTGAVVIDTGVKDSSKSDSIAPGDSSVSDSKVTPSDTTSPGDGGSSCNPHPGDECNLVTQDCADATASCRYDGEKNHNVCVKVATGTKLRGETCGTDAECDKGMECANNKCSPACCFGDDTPCGPSGRCAIHVTDEGSTGYDMCDYSPPCNPFKYDCPSGAVCLFDTLPDRFRCSKPSPGTMLSQAPGRACMYRNDCGESQGCSTITTGGDSAGAGAKCYLYCWLTKPTGWTVGTNPDGRFPADGNCNIGGVNYGTCRDFSASGLGGGLGICVP